MSLIFEDIPDKRTHAWGNAFTELLTPEEKHSIQASTPKTARVTGEFTLADVTRIVKAASPTEFRIQSRSIDGNKNRRHLYVSYDPAYKRSLKGAK